ncbi:MAG: 50S ribosomal protein L14e [Candidatus Nezhaarchaeota archaeon]|nr:50S ribosomal protein L14e [Candidatus Nezhaarchaeota archaeon]
MPAIEVGRVCVKTTGREAGLKCVIVDLLDENFVLITGPKEVSGVKRRRVNIKHLMPLEVLINIPRGASDGEVERALEREGVLDLMRAKVKPMKAGAMKKASSS